MKIYLLWYSSYCEKETLANSEKAKPIPIMSLKIDLGLITPHQYCQDTIKIFSLAKKSQFFMIPNSMTITIHLKYCHWYCMHSVSHESSYSVPVCISVCAIHSM